MGTLLMEQQRVRSPRCTLRAFIPEGDDFRAADPPRFLSLKGINSIAKGETLGMRKQRLNLPGIKIMITIMRG